MSDPVCVCVCVCVCRRAESLSYCAESLLLIMSGMLGLADSCYRMWGDTLNEEVVQLFPVGSSVVLLWEGLVF